MDEPKYKQSILFYIYTHYKWFGKELLGVKANRVSTNGVSTNWISTTRVHAHEVIAVEYF